MINEIIKYIEVSSGEIVTTQSVVELVNDGVRNAKLQIQDSITPATPAVFETGDTRYISSAKLTETKVIVCYRDAGNSNYGTACILDISTSTITPATPAVFESADVQDVSVCALTETKVIVCYRDNGNTAYGTACILDISTSTITPATPAVFESASSNYMSVKSLTETKAIVAYSDAGNSNYGTACILDINTSTITPATPAVFESANTDGISISKLTFTKAIVVYRDISNSNYGTACILDISTSTITPATPTVFESANANLATVDSLTPTKAIVGYRNSTNSNYGTACILDINTSTITPATPAVFENSHTILPVIAKLTETKAIVAYYDSGNSSYGTACILDISTSTITPASPIVFNSASTTYLYLSVLNVSKSIVSYQNGGDSSKGTSVILDLEVMNPSNAIGIAKTGGTTGKIAVSLGYEIGGFSGLTQGEYYYISNDGVLTKTPENLTEKVAIATSSTTIIWLRPII